MRRAQELPWGAEVVERAARRVAGWGLPPSLDLDDLRQEAYLALLSGAHPTSTVLTRDLQDTVRRVIGRAGSPRRVRHVSSEGLPGPSPIGFDEDALAALADTVCPVCEGSFLADAASSLCCSTACARKLKPLRYTPPVTRRRRIRDPLAWWFLEDCEPQWPSPVTRFQRWG